MKTLFMLVLLVCGSTAKAETAVKRTQIESCKVTSQAPNSHFSKAIIYYTGSEKSADSYILHLDRKHEFWGSLKSPQDWHEFSHYANQSIPHLTSNGDPRASRDALRSLQLKANKKKMQGTAQILTTKGVVALNLSCNSSL